MIDPPVPADELGHGVPEPADYATYCPDCGATFCEGEEGFDQDECFECGEANCFEVNA